MRHVVLALLIGIGAGAGIVGATAASPPPGACAAANSDPANSGRDPAFRAVMTARDAIWYSRWDQLAALLDDCVSANAKDATGSPLLHSAANRDKPQVVRMLLAKGADRSATDARGKRAIDYATSVTAKEMLGGSAAAAAAAPRASARDKECQAKYQADAALCSDSTCRMSAMRKWGTCKQTGRYW